MPKRKRHRLPDRLLHLKNSDKEFHESWTGQRNMLDFPHPFRAVFLGPPNVGKSTTVKNILIRADPPFERVTVIHCDPPTEEHDGTKEYADLGDGANVDIRGDIPKPSEFDPTAGKHLVIIDDLELKGLCKQQRRCLDRLFGYVSTHKNISVCLCSQDPFNVPPIVRRCSNLWVMWRGPDLDAMSTVARKSGMTATNMKRIFDSFEDLAHDSLWIDRTSKTPYPLRKNGFTILKRKETKG
jgi:hypothetical protein